MKKDNAKVLDFSGQNIYIGIDDHLRQWNVGIYTEHSFHKVFQQECNAEQLRQYLERHFPKGSYVSVCEIGYKGFTTHRELESAGIRNMVVNPSDVPTQDRERKQKRDKIDACKLGKTLRGKLLEGIYVPPVELEQDRSLFRYRCNNLTPKVVRIKNQIKSFVRQHGHRIPVRLRGKKWNKAFRAWLEGLEFCRPSARLTLDGLLSELSFYEDRLGQVNRHLIRLSQEERYGDTVKLLRTIPGVGLMTALALILELGDIERFKDLDHLSSYMGLIPNVSSSDDKEYVGRQTNRGRKLLRRLWIQSSWRARSLDPALLQAYEEYCLRMKAQRAIIKIAKKLLSKTRHVWLKGEVYQMGIK